MVDPENRSRNQILSLLSASDFALLAPDLHGVRLNSRQRLQSSNRAIETVYFLDSGLASVVVIGRGRDARAEVAVVGREGMTGLAVVHGTDQSPYEIFVQVEGDGRQIAAGTFRSALVRSATMRNFFLLYSHAFSTQSGYTALANARGTLEERLARWLLMAQDRLDTEQLLLTHEFMALMLGVRRAGVTTALQHFERNGWARRDRGAVTILDRQGLEEAARGLYGPAEAEYERLFGRNVARPRRAITP